MTVDTRTAQAWTLTFYAYKGGTGRTLALANVARYMAEELGYRIGLVDLDLESPGLSHEPLCSELELEHDDQEHKERREHEERRKTISAAIDRQLGFVDLLNARFTGGQTARNNLDEYVFPLNSEGDGSIVLMPTAKGSVTKGESYSQSLEAFSHHLTSCKSKAVAELTKTVLEEFIQRYNLDFLFLDGRTGTGAFFPIYTYAIPQLLVLFFGLNEQNIKGSLSVLQAKTEDEVEEAPVLLVASPVPTVGPEMLESRLDVVTSELRELQQQRSLAGKGRRRGSSRYIYELPRRVEFMLPYSDLASYEETYFPRRYPHSQLAREYRRLANAIEQLVLKQPATPQVEERSQADRKELMSWGARQHKDRPLLRIAAENITHAHFSAFFEWCKYPPEQISLTEDDGWKLTVRSEAGIDFQVELWPSEDKEAPWEVLADPQRELPDPPDVLLIPQIYLGPVSQRLDNSMLLNLTDERLNTRGKRPHIFEYRFLDRYYPGWRRWCSFDARIMGVPFSINTMLLCANEDLLSEVCHPYWMSRIDEEAHVKKSVMEHARFLPSSWPALLETLRQFNRLAPTDRSWQPFRMILHERGLYYEWLNLVIALGGVDLQEGEGRLLEEVGISDKKVVLATELFRDLALNTAMPEKRVRMDQQIADFGQKALALYVAWTDSFKFQRPAETLEQKRRSRSRARKGAAQWETTIARVPGRTPPLEDLKIHLGRLPRDVNYPRKTVVDGWLMVFPAASNKEKEKKHRAFHFASTFLAPENQMQLLQRGFPTASLWAIEKELEECGERSGSGNPSLDERNYAVFLHALRAAITDGHWVPSPERKVNDLIQETLREILEGESAQQKLGEAEARIKEIMRELGERNP